MFFLALAKKWVENVAFPTFHSVSEIAEEATSGPSEQGEVRDTFLLKAERSRLVGPSSGSSRGIIVHSCTWLAKDCCILLCCLCKTCKENYTQRTSTVVYIEMSDERLWSVKEKNLPAIGQGKQHVR